MFKNITQDIHAKRYAQITLAFMLFVFIQKFFYIPHAIWIVITGCMVYGAFYPGAVIKKAYLRFIGTITGVAAASLIWYVLHCNFRFASILLAVYAWICVFFVLLPYNRYIIIMTLFSDFLIQSFDTQNFYIQYYIFDRIICTLLVFTICVLIEHLWFGKSNITYLSYKKIRDEAQEEVESFYKLVQSSTRNTSKIFKQNHISLFKLQQLENLTNDLKYESNVNFQFSEAEKKFNLDLLLVFRKIVAVHYLQKNNLSKEKLLILNQEINQTFKNFRENNE